MNNCQSSLAKYANPGPVKNIVSAIVLLFMFGTINAQTVVSDEASYTPEASAALDVHSISRGLLPPRMSTAERDLIDKPVEGLLIFNISNNALEVFNGTVWGSATSNFICGSSQIGDASGNYYNTIKIGNQCWMAENMNIGTMIVGTIDQNDNSILEKYCYNDSEDSCKKGGAFYQWDELMNYSSSSSQGICPDGWHVPSDEEWCTLEKELDLTIDCNTVGWRGIDAGTRLKQGGISGFNGLFAGQRNIVNAFENFGTDAYYWTSTKGTTGVWNRNIHNNETRSSRNEISKNYGLNVRCLKNIKEVPTVTTDTASNITSSSADCAGEIIDIGFSLITQYGHCWSTSPEPNIDDDLFNLGSSDTTGIFISNIHDLTSYTTYYVRAYAINSKGVNYSADISFTTAIGNGAPCPGVPTITHGGQVYNTVLIGDQCWFRENLNIGSMIDGSVDQSSNPTIEKYCYNNSPGNCDIYGGLYQWNEMMQYATAESSQGICPIGWHIPTNLEWCVLEQFLDEAETVCDPPGTYGGGIDAAGKLKMSGTTYWNSPNMAATNISGYTLLPGGYRTTSGNFSSYKSTAYLWTSNEANTISAKARKLLSSSAYISWIPGLDKKNGYSVRCIKD